MNRTYIYQVFIACLFIYGCSGNGSSKKEAQNKILVTDMSGRKVQLPATVNKVVASGLPGAILLYTIADDKIVGRNNPVNASEKKYCKARYCQLPVIGSWFANNGTRNMEELVSLQPDMIVSGGNTDKIATQIINKDQALLKIPIIQLSTELTHLTKSYQLIGKLLSREKKSAELIEFINRYVPFIVQKAAQIPEHKKKRIYLAIGKDGLSTSPRGSLHSQVIELAGGNNVVTLNKDFGHVNLSIEQVLNWNPDIIITCGKDSSANELLMDKLLKDKRWASIKAIKNKEVYNVPTDPFCWIDMPPSVNQVLGLIWLSNLLYPELFRYDIEKITQEFYAKFYHYELSTAECKHLLGK